MEDVLHMAVYAEQEQPCTFMSSSAPIFRTLTLPSLINPQANNKDATFSMCKVGGLMEIPVCDLLSLRPLSAEMLGHRSN